MGEWKNCKILRGEEGCWGKQGGSSNGDVPMVDYQTVPVSRESFENFIMNKGKRKDIEFSTERWTDISPSIERRAR